MELLDEVYKIGESIDNGRDIQSVFLAISEETGELAKEIRVMTAHDCYKEAGEDGILGEACDVLIATIDLLSIAGFSKEDVRNTIQTKLNKWYDKAKIKNSTKIRINSLETMLKNGCFFNESGALLYDENEMIKNKKDYEDIDADYEVMHMWTVLFEHEIASVPFETETYIENDEIDGEFIYLLTDIGTVQLPNIEGVFYEVI